MPDATTGFDPTDGTTPVTLPTQDPCCQSPCDPPWQTGPSCITFTETQTSVVSLEGQDVARGFVTINVTYAHRICLIRAEGARRVHEHHDGDLGDVPGESRKLRVRRVDA